MKYLLTILILISCFFAFSQQKGATPISDVPLDSARGTSEIYAVVVGISDYQDEGIPDLRFADKDAEAFAGFLQSPAGGSLDEDHLRVLINEQATQAQFAGALDWLWEVVGENDKAIIYFSGHGDVEKKSFTQPGFLLCWDAPARVYMAGGAFPLSMMQEVITTLSLQNKAKVIMIADACRAGKLSGDKVGGAQLTNSNLAKQYANEIKILSCQPDEFSIEGEQWGGGRGAFSYHLLDGLYGMADGNEDRTINLKEIDRYLEDRVSEEVAPQSQNPMTVGSKTEKLTDVFPEILAQLKEGRKGQMQMFTSTESRGIEDDVLAQADSNIVEMYFAFQKAIDEKQFLEPANACADFYYEKLSREPQLERLHSGMRRNYAAALQDDAQQVLNRLLKSESEISNMNHVKVNQLYGQYPQYLGRAGELLGVGHYMYRILSARSFWFEGFLADKSHCACENHLNADKVLPYYHKALEYQPEMPHAWAQMAAVYGIQKRQVDSAEHYANLAIESVPGWLYTYHWIANVLMNNATDYGTDKADRKDYLAKAKEWLDKGLAIDSNSVPILDQLAYWYNIEGLYEKEQQILDSSFSIDSLAATMHFKGEGYISWKKYEEAEKSFLLAINMDSSLLFEQNGIFKLYRRTKQFGKLKNIISDAISKNPDLCETHPELLRDLGVTYLKIHDGEEYFEEAVKLMERFYFHHPNETVRDFFAGKLSPEQYSDIPTGIIGWSDWLAMAYLKMGRLEEAKKLFLQIKEVKPKWAGVKLGIGCFYQLIGEEEKAKKHLRRVIDSEQTTGHQTVANWMRRFLIDWPWYGDGNAYFQQLITWFPDYKKAYYNYAVFLAETGNIEDAYLQLTASFEHGYLDFNRTQQAKPFNLLRENKERWDALMQQYFPDQYKTSDE